MEIKQLLNGARQATTDVSFGDTLKSPFKSLIGTMLSARTRDEVTEVVCEQLFKKVKSFQDILDMPTGELEKLVKRTGFYKTKTRYMKNISKTVITEYGGEVPDSIEELIKLSGVGRKTANLVVSVAFGKPSVCVDTHVHRICNRTAVVNTETPDQTESSLRKTVSKSQWSKINRYLVPFGKQVCTPLSPKCSGCPLNEDCPKIGVGKRR
ncbi:MAG: endonuclease III [Candidatus Altiarchaeota archaeon]|nr:endonuclease III [Candidatus Altiarchaeota archaeon]